MIAVSSTSCQTPRVMQHFYAAAASARPLLSQQYRLFSCHGTTSSSGHDALKFTNAIPAAKLGTCHHSLSSFQASIEKDQKDIKITVEKSTLMVLTNVQRRKILLGRKLRGFGTGKYNGFGGRLESKAIDPTPTHGAQRELLEEANISLPLDVFASVGTLNFSFEDSEQKMVVHLFHVNVEFREDAIIDKDKLSKNGNNMPGVIIDPSTIEGCDGIVPKWFSWSEIPLQHMFADDSVWLVRFLSSLLLRGGRGKHNNSPMKMNGWFHFGPGGDKTNQIDHYFLDT